MPNLIGPSEWHIQTHVSMYTLHENTFMYMRPSLSHGARHPSYMYLETPTNYTQQSGDIYVK